MSLTFESGDALPMCTYRRTSELVLDHIWCVFIGYPQGYKGWKFYNPTSKKTVIAERADFDERYFPLSKCPSSPSVVLLNPAAETTPAVIAPPIPRQSTSAPKPSSTPYYVPPDSDDDDDDESLDHGGEIVPTVAAVAPAPAPAPPSPPARPPSPVAPPRAASPIGILESG
ncbi:hypothetical protein AZE42_13717 [Rhizopogon vesiculosus]|uniref:Retroviral polymerase SH3-like domain-containing protein n=1 Tax=Rhizopogon vesiculosus TaxID=180088 RepID=A0A1J8R4Z2_9AGAM|nr:hypothetical protein AZE42_13717 [Rhizopogon vesiculosus]